MKASLKILYLVVNPGYCSVVALILVYILGVKRTYSPASLALKLHLNILLYTLRFPILDVVDPLIIGALQPLWDQHRISVGAIDCNAKLSSGNTLAKR